MMTHPRLDLGNFDVNIDGGRILTIGHRLFLTSPLFPLPFMTQYYNEFASTLTLKEARVVSLCAPAKSMAWEFAGPLNRANEKPTHIFATSAEKSSYILAIRSMY